MVWVDLRFYGVCTSEQLIDTREIISSWEKMFSFSLWSITLLKMSLFTKVAQLMLLESGHISAGNTHVIVDLGFDNSSIL